MEPPGQAAAHPEAAGEMSRFRDIGTGPVPVSARIPPQRPACKFTSVIALSLTTIIAITMVLLFQNYNLIQFYIH